MSADTNTAGTDPPSVDAVAVDVTAGSGGGGAGSGSVPDAMTIEDARIEDAPFIATAVLAAERGAGTRGIWDVLFDDDEDLALRMMAHNAATDSESGYYYKRFIVMVVNGAEGRTLAGCLCGFESPDYNILSCRQGLRDAAPSIAGWSLERFDEAWERLDFLGGALPVSVDWDGVWVIEAVYTAPEFRGKGVCGKLLAEMVPRGCAPPLRCRAAFIGVAVNNAAALNSYTRFGFAPVGDVGDSDECERILGCRGFRTLSLEFGPREKKSD